MTLIKRVLTLLLILCAAAAGGQPRIVTTIGGRLTAAGTGDSCGNEGIGGPAVSAVLNRAKDICIDSAGNVYYSSFTGVMRIDAGTGIVTHVAGGGPDLSGSDTIPATAVGAIGWSICIDGAGRLLMATGGPIIRVDLSTGYFDVVAGTWPTSIGYSGDGGPATAADLEGKRIAVDAAQNIYISDWWNSAVRRIDAATGIISKVAGSTLPGFSGDGGPATAARLSGPGDIKFDTSGNMYIVDGGNYRVRKIDATTGVISTIAGAGGGLTDFSGMGGLATAAYLNDISCIAFDDTGYLYIVSGTHDYTGGGALSSRISRVNMVTGVINLWAGGHRVRSDLGYPGDGLDADSAFFEPLGLCFDSSGNAYMADNLCRVRKIWAPVHEGGGGGGGDTTVAVASGYGGGVQVYPNPVRSVLHVGGGAVVGHYTLSAITGRSLHDGVLPPKQMTAIDMSEYPPGIYLLRLQWEGGGSDMVRVVRE